MPGNASLGFQFAQTPDGQGSDIVRIGVAARLLPILDADRLVMVHLLDV